MKRFSPALEVERFDHRLASQPFAVQSTPIPARGQRATSDPAEIGWNGTRTRETLTGPGEHGSVRFGRRFASVAGTLTRRLRHRGRGRSR